jgi:hypothetical protein
MITTLLNPIEFIFGLGCALGHRMLDPRHGFS